MISDYGSIEKKWQKIWVDAGLNNAERSDKPKFMIVFAYPGVTGYLHVGHMRGFSYADAIARYKRMTGYNVLFPVGTHATGNGSISLASKIKKGDKDIIDYLERNGCARDKIQGLTKPEEVVNFFNKVYQDEYWKRFGFLADWRRFTCTIYPDYAKFIQWQYHKLMDTGLLIQKPYYAPSCTSCGPVAVDPSETDISSGGNAETQEYTLLKFRHENLYLVAATLRPETVFGQVCFWVNPKVNYFKIKHREEIWIVSSQAFEKLRLQKNDIEKIGEISGESMIGWKCVAPLIHKEIPVLPATFCDPNVGTGLVTSCPSDAPDDWISLQIIKKNPKMIENYGLPKEFIDSIAPISIIEIEDYGEFPAQSIIKSMSIEDLEDPKLIAAKKQVYKDEYHKGKMKEICGDYAGLRVEEAKERVKNVMFSANEADTFYDLTEEVICRCGQKVLIKRIDDQWFIDYANQNLTQKVHEHCKLMHIEPKEYYNNIHGVLDWLRERACVRLGNWLGTRFPFDEKWIIEAISDSTLYPIYYLVSLYTNSGQIKPHQMNEEFFDYIYLGKGDIETVSKNTEITKDLLDTIRKDVEYWYPLDLNLGGKEHMTVHFPVFLFNHIGILSESMWPKGIMVNWYVTGKKGKISKSKGGAQPIPGAVEKFSVDGMRLYYAHSASPFADIEWDEDTVMSYKIRIDKIVGFVDNLFNNKDDVNTGHIDEWILSKFDSYIETIRSVMDRYDLRQLATTAYFEMFNDLKWYIRRGGNNNGVIKKVLKIWFMAMMPITPHIAEELWSKFQFDGLVSTAQFPSVCHKNQSLEAEYKEDFIRNILSDITEITKITGATPKKIILYTASTWKIDVYNKAIELHGDGRLSIPSLIKECMAEDHLKKLGKVVSEFAKKIVVECMRSPIETQSIVTQIKETEFLLSVVKFMTEEIGCNIEIYSSDAKNIYDPRGKSKTSTPGRPAIYLE
ncbi:MAG: leucine--tRNA ligase [archaeon]|nr:leucine--tRNA ligase [archaeon]